MRAAYFPADSQIPISLKKILTQHPTESAWERLVQLVQSVWPDDKSVIRMGIAVPGPTDPYKGIIFEAPNIPAWKNLPLVYLLKEQFKVPVDLGNDANLAAMGEWKYGAGRGHRNLAYMTVSTGIGGGVILDDRLLLGERGLATEFGHITVQRDGPLCGCGQRGHLEALAAGPAIAKWVINEIDKGATSRLSGNTEINTKMVAEAAKSGDELAVRALERAGTYIGRALADVLHMFNPSIVIIGGGVSQSGNLLMTPMRESMEAHVMDAHYLENLTLTTAALGDDTGLLGALALARHQS